MTGPTITLTTPADLEEVVRTDPLAADFACADEPGGSGLASCVGTVADGQALDTGTEGPQDFTVVATDVAGNTTTVTHTCVVTLIPAHPFGDVAAWVTEAVDWITYQGYATGYPGDLFRPDWDITRAQVTRMLYRIAGSPDVSGAEYDHAFTDVPGWVDDAVRWITYDPPGDTPPLAAGYPGNLYRPDWDITRAQVTRMLYRLNT